MLYQRIGSLPASPCPQVKAAGKYRQEGKTYVVVDGDIIHFQVRCVHVCGCLGLHLFVEKSGQSGV